MQFKKKVVSLFLAAVTAVSMSCLAALPARAAGTDAAPAVSTDDEDTYAGCTLGESAGEPLLFMDADGISTSGLLSFGARGVDKNGNGIDDEDPWDKYTTKGSPRVPNAPTIYGIDVSKWQNVSGRDADGNTLFEGAINWNAVKQSGIDFVIIKMGGRKVATGEIYMDPCFDKNIRGALAAGLMVGVYFWTGATTVDEAAQEANWVIEHSKGYTYTLPVFMDYEFTSTAVYKTDRLRDTPMDSATRTATIWTFCQTLENNGRRAGLYTGAGYAAKFDYNTIASRFLTWISRYGYNDGSAPHMNAFPDLNFVDIWQYSSHGTVPGISGRVDLDLWYNSGNAASGVGVLDMSWKSVYRFFNTVSGEHFYTADPNETAHLIWTRPWNFENTAWVTPDDASVPVYRLYSTQSGDHLFTTDAHEAAVTDGKYGYHMESEHAFYVSMDPATGKPAYRLYNPKTGAHLITTDANERRVLTGQDWNDEGIAWYVSNQKSNTTADASLTNDTITDDSGIESTAEDPDAVLADVLTQEALKESETAEAVETAENTEATETVENTEAAETPADSTPTVVAEADSSAEV